MMECPYVGMTCGESGLVVADDATGALECASILAGFQYSVQISKASEWREGPLERMWLEPLKMRFGGDCSDGDLADEQGSHTH